MESVMSPERLFKESDFLQPADCEPIRSVITESADAAVVAWTVKPGQSISAHVHPDGQDTWTILSGCGEYRVSANGETIAIAQGDVLVAHRREVHCVLNTGQDPLVFVSVVSPGASGFELAWFIISEMPSIKTSGGTGDAIWTPLATVRS